MFKKIKMYFFWNKVKRYHRYFKRNIVIYKSINNMYNVANYINGKLIDYDTTGSLDSAKDIARTYMLKRIKKYNRQNHHVKC